MTVTIVIPLYNKERQIERAIRSIQNQTVADWKLLVIDDGSTDRSAEIVRGIDDSRIELIQQENLGPGAARNKGIHHAEGDYIAFLDGDDEWYPWYLENALEQFQADDLAMVSTTYYQYPSGYDTTVEFDKYKIPRDRYCFRGDEDGEKAYYLVRNLAPWNCVIRTAIAKQYGGFVENKCMYGEDKPYLVRIAFSEPFALISPAAVRYHMEDSELGQFNCAKPIPPIIGDTSLLLDYCPEKNHAVIHRCLDIFATYKYSSSRRHNQTDNMEWLLSHYPNIKKHRIYKAYVHDQWPILKHLYRLNNYFRAKLKSYRNRNVKQNRPAPPLMPGESSES